MRNGPENIDFNKKNNIIKAMNTKHSLSSTWIFENPIDFEYKKYKILSFAKILNEMVSERKLFPSLLLVNFNFINAIQFLKANSIFLIENQPKAIDEDIEISDLSVFIPTLNNEEKAEIIKVYGFFIDKLLVLSDEIKKMEFSAIKEITLNIDKNHENLLFDEGFLVFNKGIERKIMKYQIKNRKTMKLTNYRAGSRQRRKPKNVLKRYNGDGGERFGNLPVITITNNQNYPINETVLPVIKRKIINLLYPKTNLI